MIIVSQNKDKIINFNNVNYVDVDVDSGEFIVEINYGDANWDTIGWYKTEERAKEVLEEIVICYAGDGEFQNQEYVYYEMPEE